MRTSSKLWEYGSSLQDVAGHAHLRWIWLTMTHYIGAGWWLVTSDDRTGAHISPTQRSETGHGQDAAI